MEPMRYRHIALGNGDEAGEPRLGGEEIIGAAVKAAVANSVADGENLACGIEEERELGRIEEGLRGLSDGQHASYERSRCGGRALERPDQRVHALILVTGPVAKGGDLGNRGLTAIREIG